MSKRHFMDNDKSAEAKKICYDVSSDSDNDDGDYESGGGYYTNFIDNVDRQQSSDAFYNSSRTHECKLPKKKTKDDNEVIAVEQPVDASPDNATQSVGVSKATVAKTLREVEALRNEKSNNDHMNAFTVDDWKNFKLIDSLHKMAETDRKRLERIKELEEKGIRQIAQIEGHDDLDKLEFCNTSKAAELKKLCDYLTKEDIEINGGAEQKQEQDGNELVLYDFLLINNTSSLGFDRKSILESESTRLKWIIDFAVEHLDLPMKKLRLCTKSNVDGSKGIRDLSPDMTPVEAKLLPPPHVNEILIELTNDESEEIDQTRVKLCFRTAERKIRLVLDKNTTLSAYRPTITEMLGVKQIKKLIFDSEILSWNGTPESYEMGDDDPIDVITK